MKLQGVSIIFVLIVVPIILILSFYIQSQVDTIALQTSYDTKLLDATYDTMSAFELNTANEDLSSVSDSLRTIIEASNNIFINTLATNLGMSNASKSYLQPYLPAILYTLYDGYYIYAPTNKPVVASDTKGQAIVIEESAEHTGCFSTPGLRYADGYYYYDLTDESSYASCLGVPSNDFGQILYKTNDASGNQYTTNINDEEIYYETDYVLKSYMPYSARYQKDLNDENKKIDITINYTLDNYLTIEGNIGNVYYTKAGYLIEKDLVEEVTVNGNNLLNYNDQEAEEVLKNGGYGTQISVTFQDDSEISYTYGGENYASLESDLEIAKRDSDQTKIAEITNKMQQIDAIVYYAKSAIFSNWVYNNLENLYESDANQDLLNDYNYVSANISKAVNVEDTKPFIVNFEERHNVIFNSSSDPEAKDSSFNSHKMDIIRNAIQYNLNLAMSTYNITATKGFSFNMPVITDEEWDKILSHVSIVTFMQGFQCGLKTYNNYAIVSSTNNELTIMPKEIYYIHKSTFNDENATYHKIDCPAFDVTSGVGDYISFTSKEVKYDKILDNDTVKYDHKNYACYICGIDGNYSGIDLNATGNEERKMLYYTAIGAQRQELYKMNAISLTQGIEVIYDKQKSSSKESSRNLREIKELEITFGPVSAGVGSVVEFDLYGNLYYLNRNIANSQTITVSVHVDDDRTIQLSDVQNAIGEAGVGNAITCIKVIYK